MRRLGDQAGAERHSVNDPALPWTARQLNGAAGLLAASVLADSAVEHWRGSFEDRAMYVPLAMATLNLLVSGHGIGDRRSSTHRLRGAIYLLGSVTGLVGAGFHMHNITKRPGGLSWLNLFYGAPVGAPIALLLSGLMRQTARLGAQWRLGLGAVGHVAI